MVKLILVNANWPGGLDAAWSFWQLFKLKPKATVGSAPGRT
jgi:hypothetical protein